MNDYVRFRGVRCAAVWALVTGTGLGLVTLVAGDLRPGPGADFDEVVVAGAAWALCAAAAWASAVTAVVALEAVRATCSAGGVPDAVTRRGVPAPVRAVLLRVCGVALAGGLVAGAVAPATASPGTTERSAPSSARVQQAPAPPAGPVAPARPHRQQVTATARVTTVPGDSLWRVAEAELRAATGREPSDAEVAAYWPRIHATNRVLIGPDPDFVLPGVPLVLPAARSTPQPAQTEEQS